jgi:hypothetical protein
MADDLNSRIGPALKRHCGIAPDEDRVSIRRKLLQYLDKRCATLPEDLRIVAQASFALRPEARQRFLSQRLSWAAGRLDRDERTIRRRADEALRRMAEHLEPAEGMSDQQTLADPSPYAVTGWHVTSVRTLLLLDRNPPEFIEERKILVTAARLDEIVATFSLPRHGDDSRPVPDLPAQVLHGGALVREARPSESYFRFTIGLPRPLSHGASHEYGLRLTLPDRQLMAPHYAYVPVHGCDHFELRARFSIEQLPKHVWKLAGLPRRVIDDPRKDQELIEVDRFGEVGVEFWGLRHGLGYGVEWRLH